jgi:hypothetical protein
MKVKLLKLNEVSRNNTLYKSVIIENKSFPIYREKFDKTSGIIGSVYNIRVEGDYVVGDVELFEKLLSKTIASEIFVDNIEYNEKENINIVDGGIVSFSLVDNNQHGFEELNNNLEKSFIQQSADNVSKEMHKDIFEELDKGVKE